MSSVRRKMSRAGAVSEALKKHAGSHSGAARRLDDLSREEVVKIFDPDVHPGRQVDMDDVIAYFNRETNDVFGEQMIGQKPITVDSASVTALLEIINRGAEELLLNDMVISEEIKKIQNPILQARCKRDLVIAFTSAALEKVNKDAASSLAPDTAAYLNARNYRSFCAAVTKRNDMQPDAVLESIKPKISRADAVSEALKIKATSHADAERKLSSISRNELTRIFDTNNPRIIMNDAYSYFEIEMNRAFSKQMTGKKQIEVNIESVRALLEIINRGADKFLFEDRVISQEIAKVEDPILQAQCRRDLVVALTNVVLGQVNSNAAVSLRADPTPSMNLVSFRAFCVAVTNCNDMSPETALRMVHDGASEVIRDAMFGQLGIRKNDDGTLSIPDTVVDGIQNFDYDELLKVGVVKKNKPLLEDFSKNALRQILLDVAATIYRELRKQDDGKANQFLHKFKKKEREYIDMQASIQFASMSGSTHGVFGVSMPVRMMSTVAAAADAADPQMLRDEKSRLERTDSLKKGLR